MVKSDRWIKEMAVRGMIEPFGKKQVGKGVISYGVSSYGYDMRVADEFKIFSSANSTLIDPKSQAKTVLLTIKEHIALFRRIRLSWDVHSNTSGFREKCLLSALANLHMLVAASL